MRDSDSDSESSGDEEKGFKRNTEKKRSRKGRRFMDALSRKDSNSEKSIKEADHSRSSLTETAVANSSGIDVDVFADHYDVVRANEAGGKIEVDAAASETKKETKRSKIASFQLPKVAAGMASMSMLEQSMPADAVLTKESAAEVCQSIFLGLTVLMP